MDNILISYSSHSGRPSLYSYVLIRVSEVKYIYTSHFLNVFLCRSEINDGDHYFSQDLLLAIIPSCDD